MLNDEQMTASQQWSTFTSNSLPIISESSEGNGETDDDNEEKAKDLPFNVFDDDIFLANSRRKKVKRQRRRDKAR